MTDKIFKMIKDNEVKFVDFRFTDPKGKWQHTAQTVESVDEDLLNNGIMFEGSTTLQKIISWGCAVNGSNTAVLRSGLSIISDSLIDFQPDIDEPSNIIPLFNKSSSTLSTV
jgi:hypothetical protein